MNAAKPGWILVVFVILQTKFFGQAVGYCEIYDICSGSGYCHEEPDHYYCDCLPGFSGQNCTERSAWNLTDLRLEKVYDGVPNVGLLQIEVNNSGSYEYICFDDLTHNYFHQISGLCHMFGYRGYFTRACIFDYYYTKDDNSFIGYGMNLIDCYSNDVDINSCAYGFETCYYYNQYYPYSSTLPLIHCTDYDLACNTTDDCGTVMDGLECINGICKCGDGYSVNTTYFFCEKGCGVQNIVNGNFTALGGTTEGAFANIECDEGYTLVGSAIIVCESTGKWNDTTTCE